MMTRWCQKGIDGFRMDVISLISKPEVFADAPTNGGIYGAFDAVANGPHVHDYLQEMNREVNTMGSKVGDAEFRWGVVEAKSCLERIREQIQNVE